MTDVLIRGLSRRTVEHLNAQATAAGLSRNEYLVRTLEATVPPGDAPAITAADWARSADIFADLGDPEVMKGAWQ